MSILLAILQVGSIDNIITWADRLGTVSLLLLILILGAKQVWVFGFIYEAKVEECEKWRKLAMRSKNLLHTITDLAEDTTNE